MSAATNLLWFIHIMKRFRLKKAAQQAGVESNSHNQDKGIGNWLTVTSPDDLFKLNIDVDF